MSVSRLFETGCLSVLTYCSVCLTGLRFTHCNDSVCLLHTWPRSVPTGVNTRIMIEGQHTAIHLEVRRQALMLSLRKAFEREVIALTSRPPANEAPNAGCGEQATLLALCGW